MEAVIGKPSLLVGTTNPEPQTMGYQSVSVSSKKNKKKVQEDEAFQRMNFLFQASHCVLSMHPGKPDIAAYYDSVMASIAKKTLLRMDPTVKRAVCKGCQSLLIPGVTAKVRVRRRPAPCVLWTCARCHTCRRFHTQRGHQLWIEKPEAVVPSA